jgi:hypothetical protein
MQRRCGGPHCCHVTSEPPPGPRASSTKALPAFTLNHTQRLSIIDIVYLYAEAIYLGASLGYLLQDATTHMVTDLKLYIRKHVRKHAAASACFETGTCITKLCRPRPIVKYTIDAETHNQLKT